MRLAVSGSHGTGKSSLIAAFVGERPDYVLEPEAFSPLPERRLEQLFALVEAGEGA